MEPSHSKGNGKRRRNDGKNTNYDYHDYDGV